MTRTSKYLNQDTIAALQSFQIEKIDREITDYLDNRVGESNKTFVLSHHRASRPAHGGSNSY